MLVLLVGRGAEAQIVSRPSWLGGGHPRAADDSSAVVDSVDAALRRAREGDLHVGDRVVLRVSGVTALTDTFVVRAGRVLELPEIPPIPLAGVARPDLVHHLRLELARYVRDTAGVEARSLTRISVVGEVNAPGYYAVAPDALVGDVLMRAGGLARTADPDRMNVRRGPAVTISSDALRRAVVAGQTLDELGLRAGDEIVVPARRDWAEYARTGALVASALVGVLVLRHR
jgi:protein involved in polysaccharide export with SLBB domain